MIERLRIGTSEINASIEDLLPEERVYVETSVASRQVEFATGRVLARRLLEALGLSEAPIRRDADRVPIWPAGVLGSISHTDDACLVALTLDPALRGVGVDVEMDAPRSARFFERITTSAERSRLGTETEGCAEASRIFSAKEAVYKACFPRLREFWGFRDVEVEIDAATGSFTARVPAAADGQVEGLIREQDGRVWTVACWA